MSPPLYTEVLYRRRQPDRAYPPSLVPLSRHGVSVILAERARSGTSIHPRTPGYNARTMELFRAAGVEEAVRAAGPGGSPAPGCSGPRA